MKKTFSFLLLLTALVGLLTSMTAQATTYYVKTNGSDAANGTTWATAYATLQQALSTAGSGDQIWVAKGTYYPDEGGSFTDNDPIAAFTMKNGVAIYGGFAGNEASDYDLSLRDFVTNETILSGEIQQDNDDSNNSEHVIYNNFNSGNPLTATAVLSGFTVTKGGKISVSFIYK